MTSIQEEPMIITSQNRPKTYEEFIKRHFDNFISDKENNNGGVIYTIRPPEYPLGYDFDVYIPLTKVIKNDKDMMVILNRDKIYNNVIYMKCFLTAIPKDVNVKRNIRNVKEDTPLYISCEKNMVLCYVIHSNGNTSFAYKSKNNILEIQMKQFGIRPRGGSVSCSSMYECILLGIPIIFIVIIAIILLMSFYGGDEIQDIFIPSF